MSCFGCENNSEKRGKESPPPHIKTKVKGTKQKLKSYLHDKWHMMERKGCITARIKLGTPPHQQQQLSYFKSRQLLSLSLSARRLPST